jgi:hypothetical protein
MVISGNLMTPIPWSHTITEFGALWKWATPHFEVMVNGDGRAYYYTISDKSTGTLKPFADGTGASFEQAEQLIRGIIGKAYDPALGYQHYTGFYATTFVLANGQPLDLAPFVGKAIEVEVIIPNKGRQVYTGIAQIKHYELILVNGGLAVKIAPVKITRIGYVVDLKPDSKPEFEKIVGRTYKGGLLPGCNGNLGFMPDTVDHSGLSCPIHEDTTH